jgi:hypothetical protein
MHSTKFSEVSGYFNQRGFKSIKSLCEMVMTRKIYFLSTELRELNLSELEKVLERENPNSHVENFLCTEYKAIKRTGKSRYLQ